MDQIFCVEREVISLLSGNKKLLTGILIFGLVVILAGSGIFLFYKRHQYEVSMQIEDENGSEDKQLCRITDELIEKYTEDYRTIQRRVSTQGKNASGVTGDLKSRITHIPKRKLVCCRGFMLPMLALATVKR